MPNIGKIAAGTSATPVTVDAATGAVSIGAGGAQFIPYNATRTSLTTITINCSGGAKCNKNDVTITITAGSGSGRLGQINGLAVSFASPATAVYVSGTTSCSSCTSLQFVINQVAATGQNSGSKTFLLGVTVPVNTTGTLGNATSSYTVQATASGITGTGSGSASVQSNVQGRLTMAKVSDLRFGTVVLAGTNGTITWDAANQTLSTNPASGVVVQKGTTSIGTFTVSGTPGQSLSFSLSGNAGLQSFIRLTNAQGNTLDITPATTSKSGQTIPGGGTFTFYVGGTISLSTGMRTGAYTGNLAITANYE